MTYIYIRVTMAIYYCVITGGDRLQKAFTKTKTTSGIRNISNIWINLSREKQVLIDYSYITS